MSDHDFDEMDYIPRVIRVGEGEYYVEGSPERKFCYRVLVGEGDQSCTCGDFTMSARDKPGYRCQHILRVLQTKGDLRGVELFEKRKPKLDERFIKSIQGRDFVVYAGVLDLAHQRGLSGITVVPVQYPTSENGNEAICKATVESESGEVFTELGDANPRNVNPKVSKHILRMAATRAKARALRDFTNIGMTCLEELADFDETIEDEEGGSKRPTYQKGEKPETNEPLKKPPKRDGSNGKPPGGNGSPPGPAQTTPPRQKRGAKGEQAQKLSSAQLKAIENLSRRRGISKEDLGEMVTQSYGTTLQNLTTVDASSFIRTLQQSA